MEPLKRKAKRIKEDNRKVISKKHDNLSDEEKELLDIIEGMMVSVITKGTDKNP